MASAAFLKALQKSQSAEKKDLGQLIVGQYLGEGQHQVVIEAVDTSVLDDEKLNITFVEKGGSKAYTDRLFIMNREKNDFSFTLRRLWSGLIPDKDAINALLAAMAEDPKAIEAFTGMECQITMGRSPGFTVKATRTEGSKTYAAYMVGEDAPITEEFEEAQAAEQAAKDQGYYKSWVNVTEVVATNKDENVRTLFTAIAERGKAKGSADTAGESKPVAAPKGVAAI